MTPVLTSIRHRTGLIELDRPKALNSLDPEMITLIAQALEAWREDDSVDQVMVISRHPKAFCAGGDVRNAREAIMEGRGQEVDDFFSTEYDLNATIAEYPKPYIAVIDGIAMGGGLGISAHGSHRIVTDKTFASMPEMAIGYVTDVGMAYMSQRAMSPELAKFWGITGYRMYAADLIYAGIATGYVKDAEAYIEAVIASGVDAVSTDTPPADAPLAALAPDIEAAFSHSTWEEILAACSPQLRELVGELTQAASPTSIEAALQLYDYEANSPDIRHALAAEKRLGAYLVRQPDFAEGVRAVLVDKTKDAQFVPRDQVDRAGIRAALS